MDWTGKLRELLPRTVEWKDGVVRFVNQLSLPHELEYVETDDWRRIAEAVERMEIRGAPAIGVAAALALALCVVHSSAKSLEEAKRELEEAAERLKSTRPTAVNLFWAVGRVLEASKRAGDLEELEEIVVGEALRIWREDEECNKRIGEIGEELIGDGSRVLTLCNAGSLATSYYGTATAPIYAAFLRGKRVEVYVAETRPYLQGARLTAWELSRVGIPVKVITDNSMGIVLAREGVDLAIVGADRITRKGYVANKIGTYLLALACREQGIPMCVAAPTSTIDPSIERGDEIVIEKRDPREVLEIFGRRIAPEGVGAVYYAFDVTPPHLVSAIVTEVGILRPPYEESIERALETARSRTP